MSRKVNPGEKIQLTFKTDIDDLDRFTDISLFVYKQNKALYKHYEKHFDMNIGESQMKDMILKSNSIELSSKVCTIL